MRRSSYTGAMSRWRPPSVPASPYITAAGYRALETELQALWTRRHEVVKHLAAAAAEGDRSENAEYQYRKKELRGIDSRIGYLQRRMPVLKVVTTRPPEDGRVFFGARLLLETSTGETRHCRIVGSDELDPTQGCISVDSPLARALLGKREDDDCVVRVGDGPVERYTIIEVDYPET